ncbi:hypothetical protein VNI00_003845 [Paramarasmius palmivorus]|uniref:Uncharacterized protein n=1 Tax=Paramarasmius palmivorus TaxID=297713 RepID=A0AAW0DN77_9AGAR
MASTPTPTPTLDPNEIANQIVALLRPEFQQLRQELRQVIREEFKQLHEEIREEFKQMHDEIFKQLRDEIRQEFKQIHDEIRDIRDRVGRLEAMGTGVEPRVRINNNRLELSAEDEQLALSGPTESLTTRWDVECASNPNPFPHTHGSLEMKMINQ